METVPDSAYVSARPDVLWYVVRTKPRSEGVADENLLRQGYRTYLPRLKVLKRPRRLPRVLFEPMFPRYLFVQPRHAGHSIAPVRSTQGVVSILRFGGVPAVVQACTLEGIRAIECRQHATDLADLDPIQPGRTIVVTSGPLTGLQGLVSMISRDRVSVLMSLLGRETRVTLSHRELKLAA